MQTQVQQINKKNKITVPFYSPPSRLYPGQTPAEIIKEARAAVISTSAVGIKPVFTSRPFTPKEKERSLFGNVKKRNGRPPSSFSLRNLQNQETPRIKLPSIEVLTTRRTFHYSNNLSLENLSEEYYDENVEKIKEVNLQKLPKWKKSHSCPKEGRMVRAASFNELSIESLIKNTKNWNKFQEKQIDNCEELVQPSSLNVAQLVVDQLDAEDDTKTRNVTNLNFQHLNVTQLEGDYKTPEPAERCSNKKDNFVEESKLSLITSAKVELPLKLEENKINDPGQELADKKKAEKKKSKQETSCRDQIKPQECNNKQKIIIEKQENKKENECIMYENINAEEEKNINRCKSIIAEKSVATEFKSEYILAMKEGYKNSYSLKNSNSIPVEILELYETVKYYGIDVNESGTSKNKSILESSIKPSSVRKVEDYFNEKPNDYLNHLKENLNNIDEKMQTLNSNIDKIHKEISPKSELKKTEAKTSSDNEEFVMNDEKKYHVISEKKSDKEKAYKKWNNKHLNISECQKKISDEDYDLFWKNSYFRCKDDGDHQKGENITADLELQLLINRISELIKKGAQNQSIYETTSQLYILIKNNKIILGSQLKANILKALYLHVDNEDPALLLSLAKLFLLLKEESSLPMAFKMIFKVARFDSNDNLFLNEEDVLDLFLEGLGRSSPLDCAESCIYGYGALKFLTMNYNILSRILNMGALELMTLHVKMINTTQVESGSVGEQTQHALFQLTGALRHIAAGEGALPLFLTTNCVTNLCKTLQLFHKDDDIVTNISRTLSLLSADKNVTQVLMSVENILNTIIQLIEQYKENDKILIRLSYCLGNIVEHSDLARVQLSRNDGSLTILLNILKFYIDKDLEISMTENKSKKSEKLNTETIDDIIVKIIRIIANMSMNPIVGSNLSPTTNEKKSFQLSKLLSVLLMRKDPGITLLATLGCLNNISYYCNAHSVLIDITQGVERVLGLPSEDCQAEAARVLGNLTRHKEIRDLIYNTGGIDQLTKLLTSQDQEVVRCACGALVNMMLDSETRQHFIKAHGIDRLVKTLELFSSDWSLASLIVRAIWNSCADNLSSAMVHNNVEHLLSILANSLEEENWKDGDTAWEEFASIATDLLEKINSHLETAQ